MPEQYIITGIIISPEGVERAGIKVQAFDRDLPSLERRLGSTPQMLGEAPADAEGRFQITYTLEQFLTGEAVSQFRGPQDKKAEISFHAFDRSGNNLSIIRIEALDREYRPDGIIFNAPDELEVSIFVDSNLASDTSEYEQLIELITPVIEDLPLIELSDEDVVFLINELGLEQQRENQQRIAWLRGSALLAAETALPIEAFYGWARTGLPELSPEASPIEAYYGWAHTGLPDLWPEVQALDDEVRRGEMITRLLDHLAMTEEDVLVAHLLRAVEEYIIPTGIRERASAIARAIRRRLQKELVVRLRLVREPTGEVLAGYAVTAFDPDANGRDLGTDVTDAQGEFMVAYFVDAAVADVERSLGFRVRGPAIAEAIEVTRQYHTNADAPVIIRLTLPDTDPTLRQLRDDGHLDVPDAVLETLKHTVGIRSLADIRRRGGLGPIEELNGLDSGIVSRLDALADLDLLSSDRNETSALLEQRYRSVVDIAETPRSEFVAAMSADGVGFGEVRAAELHVEAKAQIDTLGQIFAGIAADVANGFKPPPGSTSGLDTSFLLPIGGEQ